LIPGVAMAVYEDEAVMNVDYGLGCHVVTASEKEFLRREILEGFERPTLLLRFTQAKVDPRDLMVTYDPRRARLVMPGAVLTFNAELLRRGEFAEGSSEAHVARLAAIRGGRET